MSDPSLDPVTRFDEEVSVLFDEYKILQDKIDKIGAFRITIKGWSVTAMVAALAAIAADKGFVPWISAAALDFLLLWFFIFERKQVRLGWRFNGRARSIEIQIDNRRRVAGIKTPFSSPNIARSIFGGRERTELIGHVFSNPLLERWRTWINEQARLAIASELFFYATLCIVTWLIVGINRPVKPASPITVQNTINVPSPTVIQLDHAGGNPSAKANGKTSTGGGN